jgi:LmbE family N-acetylglucosaminyl deacetylase
LLKKVLVVAAHPDDEVLGCGGTIVKHAQNGDQITAVIVCEGESLRYGKDGVKQREHVFRAAKILGIKEVKLLDFPDQRLDTITLTEIIKPIEEVVREIQPSIVYCQFGGDVNSDHKIVFNATLVATRPAEECIEAVYAFDTASSTEWAYPRTFNPDTSVDISHTLETKLRAMACYESELRPYPHPRSLEGLRNKASAWGNQRCMKAAEVFMTIQRNLRHDRTPV